MAKLRGSKQEFLNHIKLCLEEGLSKPELLTEYTKSVIKIIEHEIKKTNKMAHRINERNIGYSTLESAPKKRSQKLTTDELETIAMILSKVYDAMEEDEITGTHTDGGRITLSLTGEQMFDLFEAKRKLNG